jgi:anthranilate 1,2-dioxygenase small subunit
MSSPAALRTPVSATDELVLRQQIIDYIRYLAALLDDFKIGEFIEEFSDDGNYQLIPRENYEAGLPVCIIDDNKNRLRYRQRLIEKHWHFQKFRELRILSPVSTTVHGDASATAITNYVIYVTDSEGRSNLHLCGQLDDELIKIGGRWRIKNRRAILDSYLPTYAIVLPP